MVIALRQVPESYVASLDAVQHADGVLREVEIALLDFLESKDADIRVSAAMAKLLDALHGGMGQLALVEMTTRQLFSMSRPVDASRMHRSPSSLRGIAQSCRGERGGGAGGVPGAGEGVEQGGGVPGPANLSRRITGVPVAFSALALRAPQHSLNGITRATWHHRLCSAAIC